MLAQHKDMVGLAAVSLLMLLNLSVTGYVWLTLPCY